MLMTMTDFGDASAGPPGWFVGFAVIAVIGGGLITLFKVSMARDMARRSGMDEDQATAMTLLDEDGLSATYLAANLRQPATDEIPDRAESDSGRTAGDRLADLRSALDQGLVTDEEYEAARRRILDTF